MNFQKHLLRTPFYFALFFLVIFPLNMRKIFNFTAIKEVAGFRENMAWSLFAFDLALFLLILALILNAFLQKKLNLKSLALKTGSGKPLLLFIAWLLVAFFWATDLQLAFYNTTRLILGVTTFLLLSGVLGQRKLFFIYATVTLLFAGFLQALLGILQFVFQKSLGLKLLGESELSTTILGVAKFEIAGTKLIRAYGTFPHPNVFAAFLLLALAAGAWLLFCAKLSSKTKTLNIALSSSLAVIVAGITLSYSRSALLALGIFGICLLFIYKKTFIQTFRQICKHLYIPKILQGAFGILLGFSLLLLAYNILSPRICFNHCENDNSLELRLKYIKTAASIITSHPLQGIGMGSFVTYQKNSSLDIADWEQQPVHNIYLLIASEIGLIGLILFLYLVINFSQTFQKHFFKRLRNPFALCFFVFLLLGLIDHYFWTLPQGILIFWVCLAFFHLSAKISNVTKLNPKS